MPVLTRSLKRKLYEDREFPIFYLPTEILVKILEDLPWRDRMAFKAISRRAKAIIESNQSLCRTEFDRFVINGEFSMGTMNGKRRKVRDLSQIDFFSNATYKQLIREWNHWTGAPSSRFFELNAEFIEVMRVGQIKVDRLEFCCHPDLAASDQEFIRLANPRHLSLSARDQGCHMMINSNCEWLSFFRWTPFTGISIDLSESNRLKT